VELFGWLWRKGKAKMRVWGAVGLLVACLIVYGLGYSFGAFIGIINTMPNRVELLYSIMVLASLLVLLVELPFCLSQAIGGFYYASDIEFLAAYPMTFRRIFFARFVGTCVSSYGPYLLGLLFWVTFGYAMGASWQFYVLLLPAFSVFMLVPICLAVAAVMILMRYVSARRMRELLWVFGISVWLGIMGLLPSLGRYRRLNEADLFQSIFEPLKNSFAVRAWYLPSGLLARLQLAVLPDYDFSGARALVGLCVWGAVLFVATAFLAERVYLRGWLSASEHADRARPGRKGAAAQDNWVNGLWRSLPHQVRGFVIKDFRCLRRDFQQWSLIMVPSFLLLMALLHVPSILNARKGELMENLGIGLILNAGLAIVLYNIYATLLTIGKETSMWVIQSAPISASQLLRSKFVDHIWMPSLIALPVALDFALLGHHSLSLFLGSVLLLLGIAATTTVIHLWIGAAFARFKTEAFIEHVRNLGGWLCALVNFAYISVLLGVWFIPRFTDYIPFLAYASRPAVALLQVYLYAAFNIVCFSCFWRSAELELEGVLAER
jgi:hypothetical protein